MFNVPQKKVGCCFPLSDAYYNLVFVLLKVETQHFSPPSQISLDKNLQLKGEQVARVAEL